MNARRAVFYGILLLPLLLLAALVIPAAVDLLEIRAVDPAAVREKLRAHLAETQPVSFPFPDEIMDLDPAKQTVFAFGESSLVISNGGTFPDYLEQDLGGLQVVNLGISGIDSFSIKERVRQALSIARPDLILLYYGHNDYNNAYQGMILPAYFEKFDMLLGLLSVFHDPDKPEGVLLHDDRYWFARLYRPRLYKTFERLGLLDIRGDEFKPIDRLIAEHFIGNNEEILAMAARLRVPVVIVTPVGNWHAEPYGDFHVTTRLYREGLATTDYRRSIGKLIAAKDSEILTYDLRAKSEIVDYIRGCARPGVLVLDLEEKLEEMHFGFGNEDFLDYFHFNDRSHRLVAELIGDFLRQHGLVSGRPARRGASPAH